MDGLSAFADSEQWERDLRKVRADHLPAYSANLDQITTACRPVPDNQRSPVGFTAPIGKPRIGLSSIERRIQTGIVTEAIDGFRNCRLPGFESPGRHFPCIPKDLNGIISHA